MPAYYPPPGFHFRVEVLGLGAGQNDTRFTEVGGLSMELTTEEVAEGGQNRFVQKYPVRTKYPELVLKRGLLVDSDVVRWVREAIEELRIAPCSVDVSLLDEESDPLLTWHLTRAYPLRWAASDLNATSNAVVIESLQLFYQSFTLDRGT